MPYGETKVYFDGSHYIAIPHTTRPAKPRRIRKEEEIEVAVSPETADNDVENSPIDEQTVADENTSATGENLPSATDEKPVRTRKTTRKELFDELYQKCLTMKKKERRECLINGMLPYFKTREDTEKYIDVNLERKLRNLISRRIRMCRKANLQQFNYFCTFTYDDKKHTGTTFKRRLKETLSNFYSRKGWKYIGVWERSPKKRRLHFHGIFYIPDGTMPGFMFEDNTYSFSEHKRQITIQNMYFADRFGRNDFEKIAHRSRLGDAMAYILKYIEKSGERIVYSKGLPQFFISDIMDEDVICTIGMEDQKLLLFDDFSCWDEGCYMGKVSPEVIAQMRPSD